MGLFGGNKKKKKKEKEKDLRKDYDWFCDNIMLCYAKLNDQKGFEKGKGDTWQCKECGYVNYITKGNAFFDINTSRYKHGYFPGEFDYEDDPEDPGDWDEDFPDWMD